MSVSDVMDFKYKKQFQQDEEISLYERFQRCKMPFKTEDVKAAKQNVELGDHLAVHRALFILHFICTGIEEDKITLHTVHPVCDACRGIRINCSNLHKVTTKEFHTYQEMEDKNMFKIIWPDELISRSRDVQRIISLAKEIIHEINSEIFVTRCIYGVGVKLKVERTYFYMEDAINTIHILLKEIHKEKSAKRKAVSQVSQKTSKPDCEGHSAQNQGRTSSGGKQIGCREMTDGHENLHPNNVQTGHEDVSKMASNLSSSFEKVNKRELINSFSKNDLEEICMMSPYGQRKRLLEIFGETLYKVSTISEMAEGDHIKFERVRVPGLVRYDHSALVAEVVDENNITLIEYSTPKKLSLKMILQMNFAIITTTTKSLEEWKRDGAKKVDWHEKITFHGYKSDEAVSRAIERMRLEEHDYDLVNNNCEQFVTWCKFGLNVSPQVEDWVIMARTSFYSVVAALKDQSIESLLIVLTNISADMAAFIESSGPALPFIIVLKMLWALYQTYLLLVLNKLELIKDEKRKGAINEIWSEGLCRFIRGWAALAAGCSSAGVMATGAGLGRMMSTLYHLLRQDSEIRKGKEEAIQTFDEESSSEASLQSFQEVFHSDCIEMDRNPDDIPEEYQWLQPIFFLLQSVGVL